MEQLKQATLDGNTQLLLELHAADPLILARIAAGAPDDTPIHGAALLGHSVFAEEVLRICPALAGAIDSLGSSPLHYAAAKGHLEIVQAILVVNPETCMAVDRDGFNPLHLAAANGRVDVLRELVASRPQAAQERAPDGETVVHLCAKYGQIGCLNLLAVVLVDFNVRMIDDYGNTVLHVAVAQKQTQAVKRLIEIGGQEIINARNTNGHTAFDILTQTWTGTVADRRIRRLLERDLAVAPAPAPIITNVSRTPTRTWGFFPSSSPREGSNPRMPSFLYDSGERSVNQEEWLAKKRDALMIVAILLATMAFQAGVTPPGGVWQEDGVSRHGEDYRAGEAVVAYNYAETYKYYLFANTIGFVASLSTILLLISGLPLRRKTFMWVLMGVVWLSITSMAFTYAFSIVAVTPKNQRKALRRTMYVAVPVWCLVMAFLLFGHSLRLMVGWLRGSPAAATNVPVVNRVNGNADMMLTFP